MHALGRGRVKRRASYGSQRQQNSRKFFLEGARSLVDCDVALAYPPHPCAQWLLTVLER